MKVNTPYIFDEFFTSGLEESISPFLEKSSRPWAKNLSLKSSILAAIFLLGSYVTHFYSVDLSLLLLLLVYFLAGTPALLNTIEDLKNLEINIDVLMAMAAFLSFLIGSQMEGGAIVSSLCFFGCDGECGFTQSKGCSSEPQ